MRLLRHLVPQVAHLTQDSSGVDEMQIIQYIRRTTMVGTACVSVCVVFTCVHLCGCELCTSLHIMQQLCFAWLDCRHVQSTVLCDVTRVRHLLLSDNSPLLSSSSPLCRLVCCRSRTLSSSESTSLIDTLAFGLQLFSGGSYSCTTKQCRYSMARKWSFSWCRQCNDSDVLFYLPAKILSASTYIWMEGKERRGGDRDDMTLYNI